eukprot:TRINITY_DN65511_c0_g1_i1.p2 TRINITY_DN65511_c0_g1~~TRINITY_DN65511_c0_g1_i1.p2  ORF type:complete len:148 (+),score=46.40 TRINITY_DN65511_c0_g1_i1:68-445(+)
MRRGRPQAAAAAALLLCWALAAQADAQGACDPVAVQERLDDWLACQEAAWPTDGADGVDAMQACLCTHARPALALCAACAADDDAQKPCRTINKFQGLAELAHCAAGRLPGSLAAGLFALAAALG